MSISYCQDSVNNQQMPRKHQHCITNSLLGILGLVLFSVSCETDLIDMDSTVTNSTENEYFRLELTISEEIVSRYDDIKIDARITRLKEHTELGSRVLGVWKVTEKISGADTLKYSSSDSTIGSAIEIGSGSSGDSSWSITTQLKVYTDSARTLKYTFSNDYTFSTSESVVYTDSNITTTDTSYTWTNGNSNLFGMDTTVTTDSVVTTRSGEWSYTPESARLKIKFLDVVGGEVDSGTVSFDTDLTTIPVDAYMVWTASGQTLTFKKSADVTGFSLPDEESTVKLYISGHAGKIYINTDDTPDENAEFTINLDTAKNSIVEITCFFQATSSSETEGYISAAYDELTASIPIYIQ